MLYILFLILCFGNKVAYRTSVCLHENEEYSLCGWRCPITCVNIKLLYNSKSLCSSKWECHVGCRCSAGYVRDEVSKNCIMVQNCPADKRADEPPDGNWSQSPMDSFVVLIMAIILLVCIVVTAAVAAPSASDGAYRDWQQELFDRTELNRLQEGYPAKRSNYGTAYASPCAAASSAAYAQVPAAAIPAYGAAPPYYGHAAYHAIPAHHGYAPSPYAHRYYRNEEEPENEQETLAFSDMNQIQFDQMPMARSSYGAAPVINAGQGGAPGPVVGVFSNTNVGGCSVPLLVSCSPSIAHGRIVKSQPYYNNYNTGAYRDVEDQVHHDDAEDHHDKAHLSSEHSPLSSKTIGDKHQ